LQLLSQFPPPLGLANIGLKNVVVTAALRLWLIFHTLEIVTETRSTISFNDRYKAKWDEYKTFHVRVGVAVPDRNRNGDRPITQAEHPLLSLVTGR